ncbi:Glutamyl/glutaminyl-tRNA synthetase, class Ib [Cordyceps fumosorosea ARSEF 2679]|uniref:Glutamyl/glutaminyl-tRNA synthetase, class Ib n=1 Tax=Cordyceps fumosorosea (strain ARSEF 2679) TaxID=1081104 RepID=A0A167KSB0_CORFA|nr:Glutamyl/glutaminyl-tRNA synthetase, class Ib [Cordyceps fumosorosea ARSEF 2679]OAA52122.1 Glutamyl/glutaminyl-tRNA synthetase, class Ib [Cordyceps fumosorosea ARSEF 2679]
MPTFRGILRRGLTVDALRQFMLEQGPSRNVVLMDWTILWAMNKKLIDPIAPRHTAVISSKAALATINGGPDAPRHDSRPKHPKNPAIGTKTVTFASTIYIDQADAASFHLDDEITLMGWGNTIERHLTKSSDGAVTNLQCELHLDGYVSTTDKKMHWLAAQGGDLGKAELWEFDHLLLKDKLEEDRRARAREVSQSDHRQDGAGPWWTWIARSWWRDRSFNWRGRDTIAWIKGPAVDQRVEWFYSKSRLVGRPSSLQGQCLESREYGVQV